MKIAVEFRPRVYLKRPWSETSAGDTPMRFMIAVALAALLLLPTQTTSWAGAAPELSARADGALDLSSARKKKKARKAAKKEEYLRAVPSAPPAGGKM
jgi:hypothetical protein